MAEIEKYIAKRINKDVNPGAINGDGSRTMLPGEMTDALNCRIGIDGVVKNALGNILSDYTELGAGDNKIIGAIPYPKYNTIICFVYNSTGQHRIFEWNSQTRAFTTFLSGPSLQFGVNNYITGGGVLDDLLIWNDGGLNPIRFVNINDAKNGLYIAPYSKYRLALGTQPPMVPPTFVITTVASVPLNNIVKTTFQFAYNFIYTDNRESVYSPLSKLAWVRPYNDPDDNVNNAIDVTVTIPIELIGIVKAINIVYREGNLGLYNIFENIKNPTLTSYTRTFMNNGKSMAVSAEDQNLGYDSIPSVARSLELVSNRVFCTLNNEGFNIDESTFDLALALGTETASVPSFSRAGKSDYLNVRYLKSGGIYGVGIIFMDDFGKRTFVKRAKSINVPFEALGSNGNKHFINWTLTGAPPAGFTKYQILLSANRSQATYFQCTPIVHLYLRDIRTGENDNTQDTTTYNFQGKRFLKLDQIIQSGTHGTVYNQYQYVYLQIPINSPFIPDSTCIVRFQEGFGVRFANVLGVVGDFVIIDLKTFGPLPRDNRDDVEMIEWENYGAPIEIFKPSDNFESVYYEMGDVYNITNGAFETLTGRINGDTYNLKFTSQGGYEYNKTTAIEGAAIPDSNNDITGGDVFESPTGLFSSSVISLPKAILTYRPRGLEAVVTGSATENKVVYTLDYNRSAFDAGRAHAVYDEERMKDFYNVIAYSNPYVENSFINGLNRFLPENQYPLPIDRGPVVALLAAGNVLLAIHERFSSTLYVGEGVIRQGNDFILAKTEGVIGDDRQLNGGYGTINPESVLGVMDHGYWWDAYRGAVVRYTNAGLFAISNFGMRGYFLAKSQQLLPYRTTAKVLMAYDFANDELLITFCDVKSVDGAVLVPGETWAFNTIKNEWKTRFSFVPEFYGTTETDLLSFREGKLWQHNKNQVHNNFYGVQYDRRWKFISNPRLGKNKRWLNIHIKGDIAANPNSEFQAVKLKTKEGQESFIPAYEFTLDEGKQVAAVFKDIHTPVREGLIALRSGDDLVSEYAEIELINDSLDEAECSQVNVVFKIEEFSI
ncbi:MAG: hypothetical protein WKF87_06740 [Chryseolinea sp.]